ncbi:PilZ domain-containing protein [Flagellatimonas centrodinii]|uniref:PilZ domain-containing protein n=1 Tax=Flagellatimonas centrodinii TaxID=2806210 RepID=UPI001FEFE896|nr:PilZ domain-containing protein [Flagellatimonas centrodinii]ULQ45625.1 PilZ domain-containing protein [Flagellatimonas centrodinii]
MDGIHCQFIAPALWEPGPGPVDRPQLALSRLIGLEALQAERPSLAEGHESTPESRMQAQLDLVLDALRDLQVQLRPLPPARTVALTPESVSVDGLEMPSGPGWLALWLDSRMPQPVWLPVTARGDGPAMLNVADGPLSAAVDHLVFRLHRRAVARSRREQGSDSLPTENERGDAA